MDCSLREALRKEQSIAPKNAFSGHIRTKKRAKIPDIRGLLVFQKRLVFLQAKKLFFRCFLRPCISDTFCLFIPCNLSRLSPICHAHIFTYHANSMLLRATAGGCAPRPPGGLRFAAGGVLLRVYRCCLCALWLLYAAWPFVGAFCCFAPPAPPGLGFAGVVALPLVLLRSPSACPWYPGAWPFVPPLPSPRFVFPGCCRPATRFPVFSCCCLVFSVPLAFAPVWLGFFSPPQLAAFCVLCALRAAAVPPPPPRRLLLVVCGAPRVVVRCRGRLWAVFCGARCFAAPCCAVVRVPCRVVCCSVVLLASSFAVSRSRWPRRFCWCCTLVRCAVLFCAVFRRVWCSRALSCAVVFSLLLCGVVVVALFSLCLLRSAHLRVCAARCCPPPPWFVCRAFCRFVLPCCAGLFCALWCCIAACCVVFFGVRRAVSCCAVSCCASRVVLCCAVFPRAVAPCCVLCRARWHCAMLSCVAPFAGVLLLGALCCAVPLCALVGCFVPSGVRWRCAVGCVLCCAVVCCCVLSCALGRGVGLRCAVLSSLWLAVSSWLRCCVLCCASWCCAWPCRVVLCCVVQCCCALCCGGGAVPRCLAMCSAASCCGVPSGAVRCLGCCVLCCVLCCAVLCCCVFVLSLGLWCLGALCCAVRVVSCCLVGLCVPLCCALSLGALLRCVASCCYVRGSAVACCAVCMVLCCFGSRFLVLLRAVPCPRVLCHAVGCCAVWCGALLCCPVLCALC